jgi:aryl-alcohol dehydrogenase-like predicted oxidoreductase
VAAKTARSDRDGVRAQLGDSLRKLRTDHLDLYQLHGVTDLDELDRRSGAAEAILAAREEGLVNHVGITGHDLGAPAAHLEALRRWDLDTVMFAVYPRVWADAIYRADAEALLAECGERDVGAMAIKAVARAPWAGREPTHGTWYEPWTDPEAVTRGVRFALSTAGITGFCTPGDRDVLRLALEAADRATAMDPSERARAMAETADLDVIFPLAEKAVLR